MMREGNQQQRLNPLMTSLIVAYLLLSLIASLVVYSSCIIAARADRCARQLSSQSEQPLPEADEDVEQ